MFSLPLIPAAEASPAPPASLPPPPVPVVVVPAPTTTHRAKHPNQYTYRPKNGTAAAAATGSAAKGRASPAKPSASNTSSSKPSTTGKGKSTSTNNGGTATIIATSVPANAPLGPKELEKLQWAAELGIHLSWSIPEHLKHLSHLLPSTLPEPINVPTSTATPTTGNGRGGNGGGGGANGGGGGGEKELYQEYQDQFIQATSQVTTSQPTTTDGELLFPTHYEPPTKVRFPGKRVTMPEMKKRVKSLSEYLDRVRQEVADREKKDEVLRRAIEANRARTTAGGGAGSKEGSPPPSQQTTTTTMGTSGISENTLTFMEGLGRELVMFRDRFDS